MLEKMKKTYYLTTYYELLLEVFVGWRQCFELTNKRKNITKNHQTKVITTCYLHDNGLVWLLYFYWWCSYHPIMRYLTFHLVCWKLKSDSSLYHIVFSPIFLFFILDASWISACFLLAYILELFISYLNSM